MPDFAIREEKQSKQKEDNREGSMREKPAALVFQDYASKRIFL